MFKGKNSLSPKAGAAVPALNIHPPSPWLPIWRTGMHAVDPWVLMTVARGYRLQLATKCSVLQQKADVIKSLFAFNGADGFSNLWAVKDAGFSAPCPP